MARETLERVVPHQRHRDADEEALEAALRESMQPDYLVEILHAEAQRTPQPVATTVDAVATQEDVKMTPVDGEVDDLGTQIVHAADATDNESEDDQEDPNLNHPLLGFAEYMLVDILQYLDEDSIGNCICTCHRLRHVAKTEVVFETICRRIFPVQCPRVAAAVAKDRFALRKFATWFEMFQERPRVRYNGFYWLKTYYYKKPELNMWTDIPAGSILQVVYYRYFSFQRDGTVLYAMIFKPPQETGAVFKRLGKDVYIGTYQVERNEVFISVPTNHSVVEFRLKITNTPRSNNSKLILQEHYSFSEPDRTGWVDYFDTAEEEFNYYRYWDI
ncbi:hypothetical protein Poli38472_009527 [Pythium oligandrum]|uniref:F-box protein Hrt3/FBXO9 C-terminal domain-containing protein n=1 Tax=Pythium oligandrum TaxID=41045 RepID=A0A8K1CEL8_PYTOL|nr:hypothetical protein Poli38472_009527 [Pythium oligandrum]|eukprot:TMW62034.1 hypothetical protein Poli38472_009527 [Pythium oligandrum]